MDLAFIAKTCTGRGGTERDLDQLIRGLLARGHRVTAYTAGGGPPPDGCRRVLVPKIGFGPTAALWSLAWLGPRLAEAGGHDLVIGFTRLLRQDIIRCGGGSHAAYLEALAAGRPAFGSWLRRLHPHHRSILAIERLQFRPGRYRRVLAISRRVKADLVRLHGVPESAITVIPDGVDTERFHPRVRAAHRGAVRAERGIPADAPCLLFVGNGFRRKGLDLLLRALPRLRDRDARVLVVGHDPALRRYRALAAELGVAGRVVFAGAQPEPERFYAAADALVLPAVQEAFGNVVLEALGCGIPAVVSRAAGSADLLGGALAAGLVSNPADPGELARRLEDTLALARSGTAVPAARAVAEACSLTVHIDRTERLFEEVAALKEGKPFAG